MALAVNAQLVKDMLGPFAELWTDAQIASPAVTVPAMRELETWCPAVTGLLDPPAQVSADIALASVVAANLILSAPQVDSSKLGDSTVTFTASGESSRAMRMIEQARNLIGDICPLPEARAITIFRVASGRRGA